MANELSPGEMADYWTILSLHCLFLYFLQVAPAKGLKIIKHGTHLRKVLFPGLYHLIVQ